MNNDMTFYHDENGAERFEPFEISKIFLNGFTFLDGYTSEPFLLDIVNGFRLHGKLNHKKLEQSIQKAYDDIDALRAIYVKNDAECYFQIPDKLDFSLSPIAPEGATAEERLASAKEMVYANISLRGKFYRHCAGRFELYVLDENDHLFMVYLNHMFTDGEALKLIVKKILTSYFGIGLLGGVQKMTMMDYYRDTLQKMRSAHEQNADYWSKEREGFRFYEFRAPERNNALEPDAYHVWLDRKEMQKLARSVKTTIANILLASFHLATAKVYDLSETMVTIAMANRTDRKFWQTVAPMAKTIINRLPIHPEEKLSDFLDRSMKKFSENMLHADAPFETIGITRLMVDYINLSEPIPSIPGFELSVWIPEFNIDDDAYAVDFIILLIIEMEKTIDVNFVCRHDIFNKNDLLALQNQFEKAIKVMREDPGATVGDVLSD